MTWLMIIRTYGCHKKSFRAGKRVSGFGLLYVEASSDSVTALLVQLHQSSFLMWQFEGSGVQIPKAGGVETGTMRCLVQWWAHS